MAIYNKIKYCHKLRTYTSSVDFVIAILIFILGCIASYLLNRKTSQSHPRGDSMPGNNSNNSTNSSSAYPTTVSDHQTDICSMDSNSHCDSGGGGGGGGGD